MLKALEEAFHVFLTGTGFGGVALAIMGLCRPGDEILVSDNVYGPTKEISEKLGAKTDIAHNKRGEGKLIINFKNLNELQGILDKIK